MKDMQKLSGMNEGTSTGDVVHDHKSVSPGEVVQDLIRSLERY